MPRLHFLNKAVAAGTNRLQSVLLSATGELGVVGNRKSDIISGQNHSISEQLVSTLERTIRFEHLHFQLGTKPQCTSSPAAHLTVLLQFSSVSQTSWS